MTRGQMDEAKNAQTVEWAQDKVVKRPGMPLELNATLAAELGLARFTVPSKDVKDVTAIYGVSKIEDAEPGWVDKFAEFIRNRWVTVILVAIGFIGLILELKVPGMTIPGITAALCFILVFWAHSRYDTIFVLAIMLFIMGIGAAGVGNLRVAGLRRVRDQRHPPDDCSGLRRSRWRNSPRPKRITRIWRCGSRISSSRAVRRHRRGVCGRAVLAAGARGEPVDAESADRSAERDSVARSGGVGGGGIARRD